MYSVSSLFFYSAGRELAIRYLISISPAGQRGFAAEGRARRRVGVATAVARTSTPSHPGRDSRRSAPSQPASAYSLLSPAPPLPLLAQASLFVERAVPAWRFPLMPQQQAGKPSGTVDLPGGHCPRPSLAWGPGSHPVVDDLHAPHPCKALRSGWSRGLVGWSGEAPRILTVACSPRI